MIFLRSRSIVFYLAIFLYEKKKTLFCCFFFLFVFVCSRHNTRERKWSQSTRRTSFQCELVCGFTLRFILWSWLQSILCRIHAMHIFLRLRQNNIDTECGVLLCSIVALKTYTHTHITSTVLRSYRTRMEQYRVRFVVCRRLSHDRERERVHNIYPWHQHTVL